MELNRPYPQSWRGDEFRAEGAASGVAFVLPANSYQQVDRAMKYTSLFILVADARISTFPVDTRHVLG